MVPPTLSGTRNWHLAGFSALLSSPLQLLQQSSLWMKVRGEWWFPEKLLGRGNLSQSPPGVSLVTLQARPDLPAISRGASPTFSVCSDLGHTFDPPAMPVQNL